MNTFNRFCCGFLFLGVTGGLMAQKSNQVEKFTLRNGLQVYVNVDKEAPSVFGAVGVHVGGKNDPKEATGMAHYFEHIMFKGTEKIGTTNYIAEKVHLDRISDLYDSLGTTSDEKKRASIQKQINEESILAADYAIPNEIDRLIKLYGGHGLNAFTSFDQTVYFNSFPASQIEQWVEIYSERFRAPVFRMFQSELETVYEEKNRMMDNPIQRLLFEVVLKNIFLQHPYGQQALIGSVEHLKNPNIRKLQAFFDTYYVANNMTLFLSGDVDMSSLPALLERTFGQLRRGEVPPFELQAEAPFTGQTIEVKASPIALGILAFRGVALNHPDEVPLQICNQILSNGYTGLLDKLVMDNKLMASQSMSMNFKDHGVQGVLFLPKLIGQKFESAEKLIFDALDSLRQGKFDPQMLESIKLSKEKDLLLTLEDPKRRAQLMMQTLFAGGNWEDVLSLPERIGQLGIDDIMRIAQKYYAPGTHLAFRSKMGRLPSEEIDKPGYKPIVPKNTEAQSDFAQYLEKLPSRELELKFIDFEKDLRRLPLQTGVELFSVPNPANDIFTLRIHYKTGNYLRPNLSYAVEYMNLIGTQERAFKDFKNALMAIGSDLSLSSDDNHLVVELSGFEKHLDSSLALLREWLQRPKADDSQLKKLVEMSEVNYKTALETPESMGEVMKEYLLMGSRSKFLKDLSIAQVKKLTSEVLLEEIREVLTYEAAVSYCGRLSAEEVAEKVKAQSFFAPQPKKGEYPVFQAVERYEKPLVFLLHKSKTIQGQINLLINGQSDDVQSDAYGRAFNFYFGQGMASIVFQEIREFRSLAYGASAGYRSYVPIFPQAEGYTTAWMQTQNDKTLEALHSLRSLFDDMPQKPERLDALKSSLRQSLISSTPHFRRLGDEVMMWTTAGYTEDPRKKRAQIYDAMRFEDIYRFYQNQVQKRPIVYSIYGDLKAIDRKALAEFGEIRELKVNQIITK